MNRTTVLGTAGLLANGVLAASLATLLWHNYDEHKKLQAITAQQQVADFNGSAAHGLPAVSTPFRVAILTPVSVSALERLEEGFIKNLSASQAATYECTTFNANGNPTLLASQIEHILDDSYDLIFSIGGMCTERVRERSIKKGSSVPIVFGGIKDFVAERIVDKDDHNITGVSIGEVRFEEQIDVLLTLRENVGSVLVVYSPSVEGLEELVGKMEAAFAKRSIAMESVPIFETNELGAKVAPFMQQGFDVVMTLCDPVVVSGVSQLVKLCEQYGTTLYTSDEDSVKQGAACGFGGSEEGLGIAGANLCKKILEEGISPEKLPIENAELGFTLCVNAEAADSQNLHIDPKLWFLMSQARIFRPSAA